MCAISSVGRASVLHTECHRIETCIAHIGMNQLIICHHSVTVSTAGLYPVRQISGRSEFKSSWWHQYTLQRVVTEHIKPLSALYINEVLWKKYEKTL